MKTLKVWSLLTQLNVAHAANFIQYFSISIVDLEHT